MPVSGNSNIGLAGLSGYAGTAPTTKKEQVGRDEFLQLLITQLKNQDPEAPVDSKEFAVQLAQFTSVEKLISIDDKLAQQASQTGASMATYLGQEVTLSASQLQVKDGNAGSVTVNMPQAAAALEARLLNDKGEVVGTKTFGALSEGQSSLSLDGLKVPNGSYRLEVRAQSVNGAGEFRPEVAVTGIVTGFIPGLDPKLIVGGREVSMSEVQRVSVPSVGATA
jgi:flagellar basal-body rod modification protein FlgD